MRSQVVWALGCLLVTCASRAQTAPCPLHPSHIVMTSGSYSSQPGVTFQLRHFDAMLVPLGKTAPSCFEKMTVVSRAEIFVSNETLTAIFSEKLEHSDSKIQDFKVENGLSNATLSGKIKHMVPISFSIEGPVTTNGSEIRLDAQKIKADGIPIKAVLGLVGEHLNSVLQLRGMNGIKLEENALSFSPEKVAHLKGHITSVTPSGTGLTLRYGPEHKRSRAALPLAHTPATAMPASTPK